MYSLPKLVTFTFHETSTLPALAKNTQPGCSGVNNGTESTLRTNSTNATDPKRALASGWQPGLRVDSVEQLGRLSRLCYEGLPQIQQRTPASNPTYLPLAITRDGWWSQPTSRTPHLHRYRASMKTTERRAGSECLVESLRVPLCRRYQERVLSAEKDPTLVRF